MTLRRTLLQGAIGWAAMVSLLHARLNLGLFDLGIARRAADGPPFRVGFLPVTCHLTCPVTHFINKNMGGDGIIQPVRFSGFPEIKKTFLADGLEAAFILAPLVIALREQGVPIKIVYLGHRDGTAMMVRKDSPISRVEDLPGKTVAIPNRYSNQCIIIHKALKARGLGLGDVRLVEVPPPDMPAALFSRAVDAVIAGEPLMAQTEMDGYGRVLFLAKDIWPGFISCVLTVPERMIRSRRGDVQRLVDGIARSGKWVDQSLNHRMQAAAFTARHYYHQNPDLLRYVLSKPPDRVRYTSLVLHSADFEEIERLGAEAGVLKGTAHFDDYADPSFARDEAETQFYEWEGPQ